MNTALIIEDDQVLLDMYKDKFQFGAFRVLTADDGETGLALALTEKPTIIILDLALPKINGTEILKKIRSTEWGKNVPVIVLTNLNVDGKILEAITSYSPAYCLLKANTTPESVVNKAREILKI